MTKRTLPRPRRVLLALRLVPALLGLVLAGPPLGAAPYRDLPVLLVQPWGEALPALATGDEHRRRLHDASGHTLVNDPASGVWVYAEVEAGRLVPTAFVAGDLDPASVGLPPGLDLAPEVARAAHRPLPRPAMRAPSRAPTSGALNNLVIFVRFADDAEFGEASATFDGLFNTAAASLRSYYLEASYGKLAITTRFLPAPNAGAVVSYQDPHPRGYFRPYSAFTNPSGYGDEWARYDREQALIRDATLSVQAQVPAGLDLDGDDDGQVDNVTYIVAGNADGWSDLLWSHAWELYQYSITLAGASVVTFNLVMRNQVDLFTLAHEMFHSLGAPDLYHYSLDRRVQVGEWDLMEAGQGHMSAWMKHRYGGWLDLPTLAPGVHTLLPLTSPTGAAGLIDLPGSATQKLVVEYRRKTGEFEGHVPGSGLVVYRVDASLNGNADGPPDELYAYRVGGTLASDGLWWESYFTSDVGRAAFGPSTNPAPFLHDGTIAPVRLQGIGPAGASLTFTLVDCSAACDGRQCGSDGCGGTCGACPEAQTCRDGVCGVCLDPGCALFCVPAPETCNQHDDDCDGQTDEGLPGCCFPACAGRECGDDGCGGSCGACDDGDACTADACEPVSGQCTHVARSCDDASACTFDGCDPSSGLCLFVPVPDGLPCDDADACTRLDACGAGVCVGSAPVTCPAPGPCGLPGQCDPATGACDEPAMPDGLPCDDADACTLVDACLGGACVGSSPVSCRAPGPCELAVTCDPATGACDVTFAPAGQPCDDGDGCTGVSSCSAGVCVGAQPTVCPPVDACHVDLGCEPATGLCRVAPAPDGSPCDDGSACTTSDGCRAGACEGAAPVLCEAADACHPAGTCDPSTGACSTPVAADGTPCPADAHACTADACLAGACTHAVVDGCLIDQACTAADEASPLNACEACRPELSRSAWSHVVDGQPCSDGLFCTDADACDAGACRPGPARACPAAVDACHAAACDEAADACTLPALADGDPCDDHDLCTTRDQCAAGTCAGHDPVVCAAPSACHAPGACLPSTGLCTYTALADGSPCDDGAFCTTDDACEGGACTRSSPRDCSALEGACLAPSCDEAGDTCVALSLPEGTPCGNPRRCAEGVVEEADACNAAGACVDRGVRSCAPYATCATDTECAASCASGAACVAGLDCVGGACVLNQAPSAVAGAPQTVGEGTLVTLAADGSSDPEGQPLAYAWEQVAGPTVQLDDAAASRARFGAPMVVAPVLLSFRLIVSDGLRESEPAVTLVNVANSVNEAPIASAFAETPEVDEGAEFTLDGRDTIDPNGDALTYLWTQPEGPAAELDEPTAAVVVGVAPQVDADTWLTFSLAADDGTDDSAPAIVPVLVRDRTSPEPEPEPDGADASEPPAPSDVEESEPQGAETAEALESPEVVPEPVEPDREEAVDPAEEHPDVRQDADVRADLASDLANDTPRDDATADAAPADLLASDETEPGGSGGGSGCAVPGAGAAPIAPSPLALATATLLALFVLRRRRPARDAW